MGESGSTFPNGDNLGLEAGDLEFTERILYDVERFETVASRLIRASEHFLGFPFRLNPNGNGEGALDSEPSIVLREFDCMTFVETVLALGYSKSVEQFASLLSRLQYGSMPAAFENRLHFPYSQWALTNEKQGFFDIVRAPPMIKRISEVNVDTWLGFLPRNMLYGNVDFGSQEAIKAIGEIRRRLGKTYSFEMFSGSASTLLRMQMLKLGDIVGFTSLGGPLSQYPGERGSIAHLGIVVAVEPSVLIRAASSRFHKVVDRSLSKLAKGVGATEVEIVLLRTEKKSLNAFS